ncbi:MAG: glycosyltransferase family 1 protein [Thermoanaerobaculia bacterium]
MLNLFFQEPDEDRWFLFDRYPRRIVRRLLRGKACPGGQALVFINLCKGLDRIGVRYRTNDFRHALRNPTELACIVGKPFVLDKIAWKNPILFGAAVYSHPIDDPLLMTRLPVRMVLVPGPWMREMFRPAWGENVVAWPVGIDTDLWRPATKTPGAAEVLLYDKVRWKHQLYEESLIAPIRSRLKQEGRTVLEMRYGEYREEEFHAALRGCKAMIFLCEHETQGLAYQQALSCGVPILAWDRGGAWRDPSYYPHRVDFAPVTSVPYWDARCGGRFADAVEFEAEWTDFWHAASLSRFDPRSYILENLTLEQCASQYASIAVRVAGEMGT